MSRRLVGLAIALTLLSLGTPALAAPGMRLSWDHCATEGRVANKAFACNTNAGSERLVLSYEPPVSKSDCIGVEVTLHIKSSDGVMPAWWQFAVGGCRANALMFNLSASAAGTCEFPYGTLGAGGVGGYSMDFLGPGSWRVRAVAAVPSDQPFAVSPGTEYFACALELSHSKTVGTCGGCTTPVCIGFGLLRLVDFGDVSDLDLVAASPNAGGSEETVTWQGAYVNEYTSLRHGLGEVASMTCLPDATSPARRTTWASVKSLYE